MLKAIRILKRLIVVEQRAPHFHSALAPQIMGLGLPPGPLQCLDRSSAWSERMDSPHGF